MHVGYSGSLLSLPKQRRAIPAIENRASFLRVFDVAQVSALVLRHCNIFEMSGLLERARQRKIATYVHIDHIDGIHADTAGLRYLSERLHITGVVSTHARILAAGKQLGLETIQHIFALDSTGFEASLETVDTNSVDLLNISPALVVPHILSRLPAPLPRPFIASGLIQHTEHVRTVLQAGALGVVVARDELWS